MRRRSNGTDKRTAAGAADPGYREFHGRLLPGTEDILGVRIPDLKRLAKEILKGD